MAYVDSEKLRDCILKYQQDNIFSDDLYTILKYVLNQTQRYFYFKDSELRNDCCSGGMEGMFVALKNYKVSKECKIIDVDFKNGKVIIQTKRLKKSTDVQDTEDDDDDIDDEENLEADEELNDVTAEQLDDKDIANDESGEFSQEESDTSQDTVQKEYVSVAYKVEKTIMTDEQKALFDAKDRDGFIKTEIIRCNNDAFSYMMSACRTGFSKVYRVYYPLKRIPTCSLNAILENSSQTSSFEDFDD